MDIVEADTCTATAATDAVAAANPTSSSDESEERRQNCSLCYNRVCCYCKAIYGSDSDPDFGPNTYGPEAAAAGTGPANPANVKAAAATDANAASNGDIVEAIAAVEADAVEADAVEADIVEDLPEKLATRNPTVNLTPPMNYFAPMPSTSFTNISKIVKVTDPSDPLAFNQNCNLTKSIPCIDVTGESKDQKKDADYIPSYSSRATSDSDISILENFYRGSNRASEDAHRMIGERGAKVRAKAKIRESLVSSQDRADASYNGVGQRKDTPQVSPSIPLNPTTPNVHSAPVAFIVPAGLPAFVPTNDLLLTGPQQH